MHILRNIVATGEVVLPSIWGKSFRFKIEPDNTGWPMLSWEPATPSEELKLSMDDTCDLAESKYHGVCKLGWASVMPIMFTEKSPAWWRGPNTPVVLDRDYQEEFGEYAKSAAGKCRKCLIQDELDAAYDGTVDGVHPVVISDEDLRQWMDQSCCILYSDIETCTGQPVDSFAGFTVLRIWLSRTDPNGLGQYRSLHYLLDRNKMNVGYYEYLKKWVKRAK